MVNVDGIKKINKEDVKKSRHIVLSAIEKYNVETAINEVKETSKKKYFNMDGIKKNIKKEVETTLAKKEEKKEMPQIIEKKIDSVIDEKELKIKKISKEKREAWLSDMKGVFADVKEPVPVKENEFKIKKVIKLEEKKLDIPKKPKEIDFLKQEKILHKELFEKEKPEEIKKEEKKPKDFNFDLTPALSKKIHQDKIKLEKEKEKKKSFFDSLKEKKQIKRDKKIEQEKMKEKLILEGIEQKKKFEEKKLAQIKIEQTAKLEKEKREQKKKEQNKKQRKEKMVLLKMKVKNLFFGSIKFAKDSLKFVPILFLMTFSTAVFCYLIFFTLLVKLDFDNQVLRKIADYFPVPVILGDDGFIEYYRYKDLKDEFLKENIASENSDFKVFLINKMIISDLSRQYNIKSSDLLSDDVLKAIQEKIIFDTNVNQVAINRIRKIKDLIGGGDDFMKVATKYGDTQGVITIEVGSDNKFNNFKTDLLLLEKGEISRIEYATDGYYLFQAVNKTAKNSDINYVFIKAKTLDEYIKEEIVLYKMWSFVD